MTVLGLGTYRCKDVRRAATIAAAHGAPLIDTAPVYAAGAAQADLAGPLATHPGVKVSTKVGYMTASQADAALRAGCLDAADARHRHSIAPGYVAFQIAQNVAELRRPFIDLLYLHNPESCLHTGSERLHDALARGFSACEQAVADGLITGYGVSTWSGFTDGAFTVPGILQAARAAAGGDHHLTSVQLPVSLVNLASTKLALRGGGPLAQAADAGLQVWASSPLHGAELVRLIDTELANAIRPGATAVQAALLTVVSLRAVHGVLVSVSTKEHWLEAVEAFRLPLLSEGELGRLCEMLCA